jgi:ribulose-5-phosphate 4-epimerase/fuculose-1-phosphate aldolase
MRAYWTLRFGLRIDEATPDISSKSGRLNTLTTDGIAELATRFHLWTYEAHPDVSSIIHMNIDRTMTPESEKSESASIAPRHLRQFRKRSAMNPWAELCSMPCFLVSAMPCTFPQSCPLQL